MDTIQIEKRFDEEWDKCPHCGVIGQSKGLDGDAVTGTREVPEDLLANIYFYASIMLYECKQCHKQFYVLFIEEVDNPKVYEEWLKTYLWDNKSVAPPDEELTFHYSGNLPIPKSWRVTRQKTNEGVFTSHTLGPFITNESLYGENGVSRCAGQSVWKEAKEMVLSVLCILHPADNDSGSPQNPSCLGQDC